MWLLYACPACLHPQDPLPASEARLDWESPNRWVHWDTITDPDLFESARLGWLAELEAHGGLADGRALFCSGGADGVWTYVSLWPFGPRADLDRRRERVEATYKVVGDKAVEAYDRGDAALVPPHYTQIWRRSPEDDFVAAFFGCLYAGVIAVPAYPPDPARLARTLPRLQARHSPDVRAHGPEASANAIPRGCHRGRPGDPLE